MVATSHEKSLVGEVWSAVAARRYTFAFVALIVFVAVLAFTAYSPRWYRSEAKLFVRIGRESVALDPTATTGQVLQMQGSRENEINSVCQLLQSQELAATIVDDLTPMRILHADSLDDFREESADLRIIDRINPLHVYNVRDLAIKKFSKLLDVLVEKDSSVISIRYDAKDPNLARDVVQSLIHRARTTHLKIHSTQGSEGFFAEQSEALRERVLALERRQRDLRNESAVPDVQKQRDIQVERIGKLEDGVLQFNAEIVAAEAELAAQHAALADMPETIQTSETTGLPNTAAAGMRQQLFSLQLQEKQLLSKNQEDNVLVKQIRDQVQLAKAELDAHETAPQLTRGVNQARLDLRAQAIRREAELAALKAQSGAVLAQVEGERATLAKLNDYELTLAEVQRQLDLEVASYRRYVEKLEQARIDLAMERDHISNLNLLQEPTLCVTPVSPHVALNLAIGAMLSLFAGITVAVSLEMLSPSAVRRVAAPASSVTAPLTFTPGAARA